MSFECYLEWNKYGWLVTLFLQAYPYITSVRPIKVDTWMAINKPYLIFSWRNDILIWVTIRQFRLIGAVAFLQSCEMGLGGLNQNHRIANSSFIKRSIKIKASNQQHKQHQARDLKSKATNNNTGGWTIEHTANWLGTGRKIVSMVLNKQWQDLADYFCY